MKNLLPLAASLISLTTAFSPLASVSRSTGRRLNMSPPDGPAGSFFNQVPDKKDDDETDVKPKKEETPKPKKKEEAPEEPEAAPSGTGFGKSLRPLMTAQRANAATSKPYTAIGPPDRKVNDVTKPEYDKNGYTLYENEVTGEKSRVFEALVKYPCRFVMKIVGKNEGTFVEDVVQTVADSCEVDVSDVPYTTRENGKWISVTVRAPVNDAEMLYTLYENIDKDPRVKFKF